MALAFSAWEHIILRPSFPAPDSSLVADLRAHFQRRFADPLRSTSDRFCWDYWYGIHGDARPPPACSPSEASAVHVAGTCRSSIS